MSAKTMMLILIIADLHCGHRLGLTHPDFDARPDCDPGQPSYKQYQLRRRFWQWFAEEVKRLGHIDVLVANGDLIDGKGTRSGSNELLTPDRTEQTDQAAAIIDMIDADANMLTFGTPYHTGVDEDWEREVAGKIKHCELMGEQISLTANGVKFDFKHFTGASSVPYSQGTSINKQRVDAILEAHVGQGHKDIDILVRSHTHRAHYVQDELGNQLKTPCLQLSSKFGRSKKSGPISVGMYAFYVSGKDDWRAQWMRFKLRSLVPEYVVQK